MLEIRKGDSKIVGHARRELELAKLFTPNEAEKYDGFIGRGVLALVKTFDEWSEDDVSRMSALHQVFNFLVQGDLLSPPTDDPDEWEDIDVDGKAFTRNKRNNMYITSDERKTWFNLRTKQRGVCTDHLTGEPLEGVRRPNVERTETTKDQEGSTDADNAGDGGDTSESEGGKGSADSGTTSAEDDINGSFNPEPVEEAELDAGVESESPKTSSKAKAPKKK